MNERREGTGQEDGVKAIFGELSDLWSDQGCPADLVK